MPGIVPRWEWRTFGSRFGVAETRFSALTPSGVQESDEVYLVGGAGDNVKIRDDLMDIKVLRETDADGLERWEPVMKAGFPLSAADVGKVFEALRLQAPALARDAYTLQAFLDELVAPSGVLRAVRVHKRRVRYVVGGCTSEVSDVVVDGSPSRTIAIESEDAAAVVAAVASVGLDGYRNMSYPVGLRAILDHEPERFAVLDVGTNSIKFHVGERLPERGWRRVVDRAEITRLGEGQGEAGEISAAAQARAIEAIKGMVEEADREGVRGIVGVATAWLRMAPNGREVVEAVRAATGLEITAIPGDEESRLAFLAVKSGLGLADGSLTVFDTGGGSTQLTFGHGDTVDDRFSVDVGAVRFTERVRPRRGRPGRRPGAGAGRDRRRPHARRRTRGAGRAGRHGRRRDQHGGRDARDGGLRPRPDPGQRHRSRGGRPPDRALPDPGRGRAPRDRRAAAQAGGRDPRRRVHRPDDHGQGRARLAHRERPGPPPRGARRAVRRMRGRQGPEGDSDDGRFRAARGRRPISRSPS